MSDIINFCPDCNSVYTYNKNIESKLIKECKRCGYIDSENVKMHFIKSSNKTNIYKYAVPIENTKYDQTLLRTSNIECPNPECSIYIVEGIFPEVLLSNKSSTDRIMTMTCVHCSHSW